MVTTVQPGRRRSLVLIGQRNIGGSSAAGASSSTQKVRFDADPFAPVMDIATTVVVAMAMGYAQPWLLAAGVVVCLAAAGSYRRRLTLSALDAAPRVLCGATIGAAVTAALIDSHGDVGRVALVVATLVLAVLVSRSLSYQVERVLRRHGRLRRRAMIVGAGPVGAMLATDMPECGLEQVAVLPEASLTGSAKHLDGTVLTLKSDVRAVITAERIATVVIAFPEADDDELLDLVRQCNSLGCEVFVVPRLWQDVAVSGNMDHIGPIPLRRMGTPMRQTLAWQVKLLCGKTLAGATVVAILPLLGLVAAVVKLSDRSAPVLFRQTRVGLDGREFELLKFRSMSPANELESQTNWTIEGDPRIGTVGRFLRSSSLDELPQLWNIVRGDMTLVGPRPERPHFVEEFSATIPGYAARHRVPVGLTGWAAIHRLYGDTSIDQRARYDNFYIANWSLWLDVKIILRTVWVVLVKFGYRPSAQQPPSDGLEEPLAVGQPSPKAAS